MKEKGSERRQRRKKKDRSMHDGISLLQQRKKTRNQPSASPERLVGLAGVPAAVGRVTVVVGHCFLGVKGWGGARGRTFFLSVDVASRVIFVFLFLLQKPQPPLAFKGVSSPPATPPQRLVPPTLFPRAEATGFPLSLCLFFEWIFTKKGCARQLYYCSTFNSLSTTKKTRLFLK